MNHLSTYHEQGKYESLPYLWASPWPGLLPATLSLGARGERLKDASVGRGQTRPRSACSPPSASDPPPGLLPGRSRRSAASSACARPLTLSFAKASYMPPRRRRSSPRSACSPRPPIRRLVSSAWALATNASPTRRVRLPPDLPAGSDGGPCSDCGQGGTFRFVYVS